MNFPIVGIGASAGGLEAIELFFTNLPESTGFGYVVMMHLDPTKESVMPELIQKFTSMPVCVVTDGIKITPNAVYTIPSNKNISLKDGTLLLSKPIRAHGHRLPFNFFLESLATNLHEMSIGIVLSGMGSDGSEGLVAIKREKGMVLVQAPNTCKYDSMPLSAISVLTESKVDLIASPEDLAKKLPELVGRIRGSIAPSEIANIDSQSLEQLQKILLKKTGHDFSNYKNKTLFRRIERRMSLHSLKTMQEYLRFAGANPNELDLLFKELLIGVTEFFRDPQVWEIFKINVLPKLLSNTSENQTVRIWVPGCSTGEEAYTIAILCAESIDSLTPIKAIKFQIFATDLDEDAISIARRGFFSQKAVGLLSKARQERFFLPTEDGFKIIPRIREMIIFAHQSIIKDPPYTKLDLISCRNVMIYLDSHLQKKIYRLFQYCLNPSGYLLLGSAETIAERNSAFLTVDSKLRWYQKSDKSSKNEFIDFPTSFSASKMKKSENTTRNQKTPDNIQSLVDQLIVQKFAPTTVLTNEIGDIVYITGRTGNYLEPSAGKAAMNLFIMARPGIRQEISIGFRSVHKTKRNVHLKNLKVERSSSIRLVDVLIQKIDSKDALAGMYLFLFSDVPALVSISGENKKSPPAKKGSELALLESELQRTKEELQQTLEEMQSSQEEMKSMNEELQSSNEEMQSSNEELTSSKEEMQSLNEELQSVNGELQNKVDDYLAITNDFKNLLDSTDLATLFLDKELKIRRFTKQATNIFHLIPTDVGRPFTDISHELDFPDIKKVCQDVLETLVFKEKEILSKDGLSWYSVKILPYRTIDDRIIGIVMTFSTVTKTKELEFKLRKTNESLDENLKEVNTLLSEKKLILKEVHHRVKNNMGTIQALLALQADAQSEPHTREVLLDASSRVQSMMVLYSKLYESENSLSVPVKDYIPSLLAEIMGIFPHKERVSMETHLEDITLSPKIISPLGIIINEMITNCMKYAFPENRLGRIEIVISQREDVITLSLSDDGVGMPTLLSTEAPKGFGLQLIDILVQQLRGTLKIEVRHGTKFILEFEV